VRKIFVVIERRADYSRFRPILLKLKEDPFFKLHLVVTGICLLKNHGNDINYIKEDGFEIAAEIPMFKNNSKDSGAEMVRSMSRFMLKVVDELEKFKPHLVLSGFDIGANFAVTVAAAHMNIPVVHIQGGEITGSIDESLRHAMSKFAHVHFPATEMSKERLIRMGENPKSIYVVGCPSIDTLISTPIIPREDLEKEFKVDFSKPVALVIQHPVTTTNKESFKQIEETIEAVKDLKIQTIVLLPNNDAGYSDIIKSLKSSKLKYFPSLSPIKYSNLLRNIWVLVGNSSSGIHEALTFNIPVVNIGMRQQGRERAKNVIDVPHDRRAISKAIQKALYDQKFKNLIKKMVNPYGNGKSSEKIVKLLKEISLEGVIQKKFYE
jgi:UDP-N-acetylglucosamine 2-epimerase (non-hydrolysing)/GDP/UDP-N,N'-diacetylbacillosamine 2-epimerase (hydrolysing)